MKTPRALQQCYELGLPNGGIYFTDYCWRKYEELHGSPYYDFIHPGVMEFGFSARRDLWLLFDEWKEYDDPIVIKFCQGSDAFVYAHNYVGFLVRMTIEEFNSTWFFDDEKNLNSADVMFRKYPEILRPIIGSEMARSLDELLVNRSLKVVGANGVPGYLSNEEMESAIKTLVSSPILNKKVQLDTGADDYSHMKP